MNSPLNHSTLKLFLCELNLNKTPCNFIMADSSHKLIAPL